MNYPRIEADVAKLDRKVLEGIVLGLVEGIFPTGPSPEWDADTIDALAELLHEHDLVPLKTETNTPEMQARIDAAFEDSPEYLDDDNVEGYETFFEHGQWWARVFLSSDENDASTKTYSVVDAEPGIDGFDFEET